MKITLLAALLLCIPQAYAKDFEFKGLKIGMTLQDLENDDRLQCKKVNLTIAEYACSLKNYTSETIGGARVKSLVIAINGGLSETILVVFDTSNFDSVAAGLEAKYGESEIDKSVVRNRFGAEFDNESHAWIQNGISMKLVKRAGKIDESNFSITKLKAIDDFSRRDRKNAADDL